MSVVSRAELSNPNTELRFEGRNEIMILIKITPESKVTLTRAAVKNTEVDMAAINDLSFFNLK